MKHCESHELALAMPALCFLQLTPSESAGSSQPWILCCWCGLFGIMLAFFFFWEAVMPRKLVPFLFVFTNKPTIQLLNSTDSGTLFIEQSNSQMEGFGRATPWGESCDCFFLCFFERPIFLYSIAHSAFNSLLRTPQDQSGACVKVLRWIMVLLSLELSSR